MSFSGVLLGLLVGVVSKLTAQLGLGDEFAEVVLPLFICGREEPCDAMYDELVLGGNVAGDCGDASSSVLQGLDGCLAAVEERVGQWA